MNHRKIKILLLCTYPSGYVVQLYNYVKKYYANVRYSIFTQEKSKDFFLDRIDFQEDENIYSFGNHEYLCMLEAAKLPHFDIIHSLWMEHCWGETAGVLSKKCDYWLCSIGGSDLYRESNKILYRYLQKRIINRSSMISSEGEKTREYFYKVYGKRYRAIPHRIIRFGVDILDEITAIDSAGIDRKLIKRKYSIPEDKIIVMCGTNARIQHQHKAMLEQIAKLPENVLSRMCLLLPMTYDGTEEYICNIEKKAKEITEDVVVLRNYLSTKEMAEITVATDIMIHVQTTDQLSSIMMAQMFNGNVVIAGNWLPYDSLREKGIYFIGLENIDSLEKSVFDVIDRCSYYKEQCKNNKDIVSGISSWEQSTNNWYNAYISLIESRYKNDNPNRERI